MEPLLRPDGVPARYDDVFVYTCNGNMDDLTRQTRTHERKMAEMDNRLLVSMTFT